MRNVTRLCFSHTGLINPSAITYLLKNDVEGVVLFGDGSQSAFDHMRQFDWSVLQNRLPPMAIARTPLYELRVIHHDDTLSKPHYVYSEAVRIKWLCQKICSSYINLSISDITSQSNTQAALEKKQVELVCADANQFWNSLLVAEDRLCFPASAIDRMTRHTYSLTPETIDIKALREATGFSSLEYNHLTDLLSITVGGDIFSVKMAVLYAFYSEHILPHYSRSLFRRLRLQVSVIGHTGQFSDPVDMSYGELGRLVEEMRSCVKEQKITHEHPLDTQDLLTFAKKVTINDDSCLWPEKNQSINDLLDTAHAVMVRHDRPDDYERQAALEPSDKEPVAAH